MAYRWYNGRLVSDEEYYRELGSGNLLEDIDISFHAMGMLFGFLIPVIGIPFLGWHLFGGPGIVIGIIVGGIIGYVFNGILAKIIKILLWIISVGLVLGIVGYLVYVIWTTKK